MNEVSRLFAGCIYADKFKSVKNSKLDNNGHIHNFFNKMAKDINFWVLESNRILIKINTKILADFRVFTPYEIKYPSLKNVPGEFGQMDFFGRVWWFWVNYM